MKRINDRREIGADVIFGNITPFTMNVEFMPESKNGTTLLQKLREHDHP